MQRWRQMSLGAWAKEKSLPLPWGFPLPEGLCPDQVINTSHQASSPFNVQSPKLPDFGASPHFPPQPKGVASWEVTRGGSGCSLQVFSWILQALGLGQVTPRTPC